MATFLELVNPRHRLLFELLSSTGLRVSEAIALQWRDLQMNGSEPHVRVRRAIVRKRVEPPKTRHGKRTVPLAPALVANLRGWQAETEYHLDEDLVFVSMRGTPLDPDNVRARTLKPVVEEVGAPWAGFHTLRHTYASLMLARGANLLQLSRSLGHHSAAFTLSTYAHLLDGEHATPLDLVTELGRDSCALDEPAATPDRDLSTC